MYVHGFCTVMFVFFLLVGDHLYLHVLTHSIPTRRSSDLDASDAPRADVAIGRSVDGRVAGAGGVHLDRLRHRHGDRAGGVGVPLGLFDGARAGVALAAPAAAAGEPFRPAAARAVRTSGVWGRSVWGGVDQGRAARNEEKP